MRLKFWTRHQTATDLGYLIGAHSKELYGLHNHCALCSGRDAPEISDFRITVLLISIDLDVYSMDLKSHVSVLLSLAPEQNHVSMASQTVCKRWQ